MVCCTCDTLTLIVESFLIVDHSKHLLLRNQGQDYTLSLVSIHYTLHASSALFNDLAHIAAHISSCLLLHVTYPLCRILSPLLNANAFVASKKISW